MGRLGLLVVVCVVGSSFASPLTAAAQSDACAPAAVVAGDPELVTIVQQRLLDRGVAERAPDRCPGVVATVLARPEGILVERLEPSGRRDVRVVSSVEMAATLIESWAEHDLLEPILGLPFSPHAPSAPTPATPSEVSAGAEDVIEPPSSPPGGVAPSDEAASPSTLMRISLEGGVALASDGSLWAVPAVRWCLGLGPICVGAAVRGQLDLRATGRSQDLDTTRLGFDATLTAEVPLRLGALALSPGVGLGAGWLRYEGGEDDTGVFVEQDRGDLRIDAFLRAYWTLSAPVGLAFSLDAGIAPLSGSDVIDEGVVLAAPPVFQLSLGVGLFFEVLN